ncbi:MAG: UvrD-helicase domain-containing protein, partial [Gammaproteobacteria bacterium]|nr:UvrD-helicase domain-containing protein [Gammaproteobacteria bacterium]
MTNTFSTIPDHKERIQALDTSKSFIVQAPAGSGKTELLTQRFLALLSQVQQPEEILAITFTKKSAAEMRTRIINALKFADLEDEPSIPHAKTTWKLAKNALKRNQLLEWDLLDNPNRLRIQTIDSLNVQLTKQLPILSHFGVTPDIANDPIELYREAVQEFLSHLEEKVIWADAIAQLLVHMDNDLNKVELLLINMLAKRDQWLPYITPNANESDLRDKLEKQLAAVVSDILLQVINTFPKEHINELLYLADLAAYHLNQANIESYLCYCANLKTLPGLHFSKSSKLSDTTLSESQTTLLDTRNKWLGLSHLLLNKEFQWRKAFDKRLGFPAPSQAINAEEKQAFTTAKQRITSLINQLSNHEPFRLALVELQLAPSIYYNDIQWETLEALHQALQIVVAQLYLIFQKHGQIDYIESAQAALTALGTDEVPTDLTLSLDYQLQHILIDEFQDTSHTQFRLIEKLTAGWDNQDGRTLFVVGDPMQSIYRFREAEVGLFIQVRTHGLGQVTLYPLTLSVNFRSTDIIVNWVNNHFQQVLPAFEDIATGAVSYKPSIANSQATDENSNVHLHPFFDTNESKLTTIIESKQATTIIDLIIRTKQQAPTDS